ncbi:MAG: branched-chain amino acid aminotransferase [Clostridiales bacterium]|jgi:branched-chain amino acid aminotransferase|nr:branched-chain amino acid aminotransferase [Clostridiales bacterium]
MDIKVTRASKLKAKPSGGDLPFGVHYSDHMFILDYDEDKGWHDARIEPYAPLTLDPAAMCLHYAQAVFEGLKAYRGADKKIRLFRADANARRMDASHERLCIPRLPETAFLEAVEAIVRFESDWVPSEPGTSLYIRPYTFATEPHLGVRPSKTYKFMIILSPVGSYYPEGINPIKILIEDEYVRAVRGGVGFVKAAANYAISLKGQEKALGLGYTQTLWLDGVKREYIEEIGTTNAFFKIDGELVTPELSGSILPGITRDTIITLAGSWGLPVSQRPLTVAEVYDASAEGKLEEAFASGTAAVISPVSEFNWAGRVITVSNGETGKTARKLYNEITGMQYGDIEDKFGWVRTL